MLPTSYVPSDAESQKYLHIWDLLDDYVNHEIAHTSIFTKFPTNVEVPEVLIKCTVLNTFYSAGIRTIDLLKVAEVIVDCNIDNDLQSGNWQVVNRILEVLKKDGIYNYYSFVSKYCNWHNHEKFPIYDSYVDKVVWYLKQCNLINSFNYRKELSDYATFGNALFEIFQKFSLTSVAVSANNPTNVNYKSLDRYLWLLGKRFYAPSSPSVTNIVEAEKMVSTKTHFAKTGSYVISQSINKHIKVSDNGIVATNTKEELRKISQTIGFDFDTNWNTRHFGKKLIEFINQKNKR